MGNDLKAYLGDELETEGLGMLKYFLGLQVARSTKGIVILQHKYTLNLFKETRKIGAKPSNMLIN